jgi:CubicO group peptidase (beta-lactamase class C family)
MKHKFLLLISAALITLQAHSQISNSQYQQIDSLFIEWNNPNHPGGVIGVMQNDTTIFSKAYGLASMEYQVSNTTNTVFNVGSIAKQFTALGIILLHNQGKLSINDDIRTYLPELPEFETPITISHMIHHTSGLRSFHDMLALAGWRRGDFRNNDDLFRFMLNQQDLNFSPGDEYSYSNTGYMLMLNIIEKVTEEKFADWMQESIFDSLGLVDTYVEDDFAKIIPNYATSYYGSQKNGFSRSVEFWGYIGSGNLRTTNKDLHHWLKNFYDPQPGWEDAFKMMLKMEELNDGTPNNYAFGIVLEEFNGYERIRHTGSTGGYKSFICTYPSEKLNIVVLTNFSSSSHSQKGNQISEILLKPSKDSAPIKSLKEIDLSIDVLEKYEGDYWNDISVYSRNIYVKDDTLRYSRSKSNETPLIPIGNNKFRMDGIDRISVTFESKDNSIDKMVVNIDNESPIVMRPFNRIDISSITISSYIGEFYSPELETSYHTYVKGDTLFWHHPRHGDFIIEATYKEDVFQSNYPMSSIFFRETEVELLRVYWFLIIE